MSRPLHHFFVILAQVGIRTCDAIDLIAPFGSLHFRLRGNDEPEVFTCAS